MRIVGGLRFSTVMVGTLYHILHITAAAGYEVTTVRTSAVILLDLTDAFLAQVLFWVGGVF